MSVVHLHLLLNHLPVVGTFCGIFLLGFAYARASSEIARFAFLFFALLGLSAVIVYATGGAAEDAVRNLPDFSAALVQRHEEAALVGTILMAVFGGMTTLALWAFGRRPIKRKLTGVALLVAIGVGTVMGYTGYLGGQIRHTEIRSASGPIPDLHELQRPR